MHASPIRGDPYTLFRRSKRSMPILGGERMREKIKRYLRIAGAFFSFFILAFIVAIAGDNEEEREK